MARAGRGRPGSPRRSTTSPRAIYWDTAGLLVVAYGFHTLRPRGRDRRASAGSIARRRPIVALLGSPRLGHVLVQAEIETFALEADGTVAWRVAHSDVVTAAELVGGRLVLTGFDGQLNALDPATGRGRRTLTADVDDGG